MDLDTLNRSTLQRQGLLERMSRSVEETVASVVGVQAQEPASPYLAVWNRMAGFDPTALDRALTDGTLVKATLMRITLHVVAAGDHPVLRSAVLRNLRAARLHDKRFTGAGLTPADADALVPALLDYLVEPRGREEVETHLTAIRGVPPHERLWWALRQCGPFVHAPGDDLWSFGRNPRHLAAPNPEPVDETDAIRSLVRRYLGAYGPATVADIGQFALLQRGRIRQAMVGMEGVIDLGDGFLDVEGGFIPDPDVPAPPRLLGMWDNLLLAHADRTRVISDEYRALVIRRNGDTLPTLLLDGRVAGVWRVVDGSIEVTPFGVPTRTEWEMIDDEAARLRWAIDRDPRLFGRFDRWWKDLPADRRRIVGA